MFYKLLHICLKRQQISTLQSNNFWFSIFIKTYLPLNPITTSTTFSLPDFARGISFPGISFPFKIIFSIPLETCLGLEILIL